MSILLGEAWSKFTERTLLLLRIFDIEGHSSEYVCIIQGHLKMKIIQLSTASAKTHFSILLNNLPWDQSVTTKVSRNNAVILSVILSSVLVIIWMESYKEMQNYYNNLRNIRGLIFAIVVV